MVTARGQPREFFIRAMLFTNFASWTTRNGWYEVYREHMHHIYVTPEGNLLEVNTDADDKGVEQKVKAVVVLDKWERQD